MMSHNLFEFLDRSSALLLLKVSCLIGLLVQTGFNFYYYYIEPDRFVSISDIRLKDLEEFPLVLQVTIHEGFDKNRLNSEGYKNVDGYFMGQSIFNDSIIGWRGEAVA